jgi:hypothetical protein
MSAPVPQDVQIKEDGHNDKGNDFSAMEGMEVSI